MFEESGDDFLDKIDNLVDCGVPDAFIVASRTARMRKVVNRRCLPPALPL